MEHTSQVVRSVVRHNVVKLKNYEGMIDVAM